MVRNYQTDLKELFEEMGYVKYSDLLSMNEVNHYLNIYNDFLTDKIKTGSNRSDLGKGLGENKTGENITQIMWPSDFMPEVLAMPYHLKTQTLAKKLLGDDMIMDFDMLINKAPYSNTITPWHQDAAYWVKLPDSRAVSFWLALDEATIDNGCMWYVAGSHLKDLRPHRFAGAAGGALITDATESEGTGVPLSPGSCVLHGGKTLHYSRGNTTAHNRRAWIINYRPVSMIKLERDQGFDHGRDGKAGDRKARN